MTTGNPRKDARISIIGLVLLAVLGLAGVFYVLDKWLVGGLITQRIAAACQSAVAACGTAAASWTGYLPEAKIFLAALSLGALLFAAVKAAGVLYFARKIKVAEGVSIEVPERVLIVADEVGAGGVPIRYVDADQPIAYTDGLFRTTIHLSRGLAESLDDTQLKGVIAHEFAHVTRRDNLTIFLALALRDFLFVFPLSHHLFGVFMRQKEHAADDMAAELTGDPVGLADAIVKVAKIKGSNHGHCPAYATFFPEKTGVRDRVTRLLGHGSRGRRGAMRLAVAVGLSALIMGMLTGISVAQPATPKLSKECSLKPECVRLNGACCISK
ncbi:MAG: M56 family metallopeptidase [Candidatus Aquicultorales bacterium]